MKKLLGFISLCIILSSCTKTVDQVVKIIKEDVSVHGKKYRVPIQIDLRSERLAAYFELKKGNNITSGGEFYFGDGYNQNGEAFKTGGDIDLTLTQWEGNDPNEERNELGRAVVHIKFNKGTEIIKVTFYETGPNAPPA